MKTLQLFLLLTIAAISTTAHTKEYDVEIIVFEDAHSRYINSESWNNDTVDDEISYSKSRNKARFKSRKPSILNQEYKRINNSSEYNVLLYSAWRQTGLDKSKAFEINVNQLRNKHAKRSANTIEGTVKVVLARYLHFYTQLEYKQGNANDEYGSGITRNNYRVESHRRMRSKELHYIDHPLVGILIQINPVKTD